MTNTEERIVIAIQALTEAILSDAVHHATESAAPSANVDRTDADLAAWNTRISELRTIRVKLEEILRLGKLREYDPT